MLRPWDWCWIAKGEVVVVPSVAVLGTIDEGVSVGGSAEHAYEVILPSLDGFFSNVVTVIIGGH